jgi:hypothetical protein
MTIETGAKLGRYEIRSKRVLREGPACADLSRDSRREPADRSVLAVREAVAPGAGSMTSSIGQGRGGR